MAICIWLSQGLVNADLGSIGQGGAQQSSVLMSTHVMKMRMRMMPVYGVKFWKAEPINLVQYTAVTQECWDEIAGATSTQPVLNALKLML